MKHFFLIIISLLQFLSSSAQTSEKINSIKFENYLKLGFKYHDAIKSDSANYFLKKVERFTEKFPQDSLNFYRKEILKAAILTRENKPDISVQILLQALTYFEKQKDSANIGLVFLKIGVANYYLNRRAVTRDYLEKALLYKKFLSKKNVTKIYQNIGSINLEEGMHKNDSLIKSAIDSYLKAIKIYKEEGWVAEEALATSLLAECYHQLGNLDQALSKIEEAILLSKKAKNKSKEGFALIKKTSFLGNKKNLKEALKTIRIAKAIFKDSKDNHTYLYALLEEKKILKKLKKFNEASIIGDEIYKTSVGNYNIRFADKVSEMDAKYKNTEKEKEIALQKEELLEKELAIKNRNLYTLILTSALLILGIIFLGIYKKNQFKRKQLRKEIDLKDALATIKTQNRLQEQRLRISRDLHDNIGSQLTFIISSLDNLKFISKDKDVKLKDKLVDISSFTSETIHELRDTIWAMNKSKITLEDLHTRILSFTEKAKIATENIEFVINYTIDKNTTFSSLEGMNIFRVIQEGINNAIKYSAASKITILLDKKGPQFVSSVIDNGIGFDIKSVTLGNGLSNMEKRMSEINGKVVISSEVKKGTTITFSLTLENTANDV